ncbi:MAG: response regulator [Candidatus Omnitrophica bacterium]|nr:response regulator [Candidatus Omnitrophota bacterium]
MSKGTVFVVEDDLELLQLTKLRLETLGCRVLSTSSGEKAVELIQAAVPDLIILDVFLPDVDGLTILKRLKSPIDIETGKPSTTKDIPIIVVTGKAPMIENMTRIEGAADFFVKPVNAEKLTQCVSRLLALTEHDTEQK